MKQISFIVVLFTILYIKQPLFLVGVILFLWIISFKNAYKLSKRVIKSIIFFNLGVSLGYFIISFFKDIDALNYIIYINLKVFSITYFVFWFFSKVNMIQFFSFSKELSFLLTITLSQIYSYKKTYEDFRLAYKARVIKKIRNQQEGFVKRTFEFFFNKAMRDSKERSLAMKARGFFND